MEYYQKNFDGWNEEKKKLEENSNQKVFYPKKRQIRYIKLWVNLWFESDGKWKFTRPMLVIKRIGSLFRCIPMTTKNKNNRFHYTLKSIHFKNIISSSLLLSQARIIDYKRFEEMLWYVSQEEFLIIKKLLKDMYLGD